MFKKKKDLAIDAVTGEFGTRAKVKKRSPKKRSSDKCESLKNCWGFCEFLKTSWKIFKEFSADTSIHGIKYLTDKKRPWPEKLFWAIALSLSIMACSFLIYDTFRKWQMAPVIVSFSQKFMNIWEIPFPAITICPISGRSPLNADYNFSGNSKVKALNEFGGSIETRITGVKWRNDPINSTQLFNEIATDEGFCYTFNMMNFYDLFERDV